MDKKELRIKEKTIRKVSKDYPAKRAKSFFHHEIKPIIEQLQNKEVNTILEATLKNYVIVRLVSIIEDFFKILVRRIIDESDLSLSPLFQGEVKIPLGRYDELLSKKKRAKLTKGIIVANEFNFANPKEINAVFTSLLRLDKRFKDSKADFFSAIRKMDWYDPFRNFKGSRSLNKNWKNFERMFEMRNEIVHHMKDASCSVQQVISLCDNAINVIDAAAFVGRFSEMDEILRIIKSSETVRDEIRALEGVYRKKIPG